MKNKKFIKIVYLLINVALLSCNSLFPISQAFAENSKAAISRPLMADEKEYGRDAFDEAYSRGIVFRVKTAEVSTTDYQLPEVVASNDMIKRVSCDNGNAYCYEYNNAQRDENIYITTKRGAILNNRYLDVREYVWTSTGYWQIECSPWHSVVFYHPKNGPYEKGTVTRELHFYEAGTNNEVNFKGVVAFSDFDTGEGYTILSGYRQAYLNSPTHLEHELNTQKWISSKEDTSRANILWIEVESAPGSPLILQYEHPAVDVGSSTHSPSVYINYQLVDKTPNEVSAPLFDTVAKYGTITPKNPMAANGYTFSGWYYDEDLTNPVINTVNPSEDITLYGKYIKSDSIDEDVEGDEIKVPDTGINNNSGSNTTPLKTNLASLAIFGTAIFVVSTLSLRALKRSRMMKFKK